GGGGDHAGAEDGAYKTTKKDTIQHATQARGKKQKNLFKKIEDGIKKTNKKKKHPGISKCCEGTKKKKILEA
ncbi:hypothetical protein ACQWB2_25345, partial [Salmonella enterica subsp. enterica serovar Infantis]